MHAKLLLESLSRGYPVGTLLLWETAAPAGEGRIGSLTLPAPYMENALWVVDGQQRIVSLARILLAADPDADGFALYFDHAADPGSRQRRDTAIQLGRRIHECGIPACIVRSDDQAILRDIFKRINSAGKSLDDADVFDAINGARFQSRPSTISEISSDLEKLEFGQIEESILHRLLRVLLGLPVVDSARSEPPRLADTQAEEVYQRTAATASQIIVFLKNDAGIPHYDLLPCMQAFVTLGRFFQFHPQPTPRLRELIARQAGVSLNREFFLLHHLEEDLPDAVRIVAAEAFPETAGATLPAADEHPRADDWHFSLAGVQLKFSARREGRGMTIPVSGIDGDWVVKLPDVRFPEVPENEQATMRRAERHHYPGNPVDSGGGDFRPATGGRYSRWANGSGRPPL